MRRFLFPVFLITLLAVGLAACRQSAAPDDASIVVTLVTEPADPVVGQGTMLITIADDDGSPLPNAAVEVRGDMAHAGMAPVITKADNAGNGTYRSTFDWSMGGDWVITVTATLADGRHTTQEFPFTVAGT